MTDCLISTLRHHLLGALTYLLEGSYLAVQAAYTTWCYCLLLIEKCSKKSDWNNTETMSIPWVSLAFLDIMFFFLDLIYYSFSLLSYLAVDNLVLNSAQTIIPSRIHLPSPAFIRMIPKSSFKRYWVIALPTMCKNISSVHSITVYIKAFFGLVDTQASQFLISIAVCSVSSTHLL